MTASKKEHTKATFKIEDWDEEPFDKPKSGPKLDSSAYEEVV